MTEKMMEYLSSFRSTLGSAPQSEENPHVLTESEIALQSAQACYGNFRTLVAELLTVPDYFAKTSGSRTRDHQRRVVVGSAETLDHNEDHNLLPVVELQEVLTRCSSLPQLAVLLRRLWFDLLELPYWQLPQQQDWVCHLLLLVEASKENVINFYAAGVLFVRLYTELVRQIRADLVSVSGVHKTQVEAANETNDGAGANLEDIALDQSGAVQYEQGGEEQDGRQDALGKTTFQQEEEDGAVHEGGAVSSPETATTEAQHQAGDAAVLVEQCCSSPPLGGLHAGASSSTMTTSNYADQIAIVDLILEHCRTVSEYLESRRGALLPQSAELEFENATATFSSSSVSLPSSTAKALGIWPERRVEGSTAAMYSSAMIVIPGSVLMAAGFVGGTMMYERARKKVLSDKLEEITQMRISKNTTKTATSPQTTTGIMGAALSQSAGGKSTAGAKNNLSSKTRTSPSTSTTAGVDEDGCTSGSTPRTSMTSGGAAEKETPGTKFVGDSRSTTSATVVAVGERDDVVEEGAETDNRKVKGQLFGTMTETSPEAEEESAAQRLGRQTVEAGAQLGAEVGEKVRAGLESLGRVALAKATEPEISLRSPTKVVLGGNNDDAADPASSEQTTTSALTTALDVTVVQNKIEDMKNFITTTVGEVAEKYTSSSASSSTSTSAGDLAGSSSSESSDIIAAQDNVSNSVKNVDDQMVSSDNLAEHVDAILEGKALPEDIRKEHSIEAATAFLATLVTEPQRVYDGLRRTWTKAVGDETEGDADVKNSKNNNNAIHIDEWTKTDVEDNAAEELDVVAVSSSTTRTMPHHKSSCAATASKEQSTLSPEDGADAEDSASTVFSPTSRGCKSVEGDGDAEAQVHSSAKDKVVEVERLLPPPSAKDEEHLPETNTLLSALHLAENADHFEGSQASPLDSNASPKTSCTKAFVSKASTSSSDTDSSSKIDNQDEARFLNPMLRLDRSTASTFDVAWASLEVQCAAQAEYVLKAKIYPIQVCNRCVGSEFPDELRLSVFPQDDYWETWPILSSSVPKGSDVWLRPPIIGEQQKQERGGRLKIKLYAPGPILDEPLLTVVNVIRGDTLALQTTSDGAIMVMKVEGTGV
ncbi:unnamed protein product [Amoebophrya sp. A25]|nr:unnamed protein product [Amoebophrya sp. A25]|eukprot:GSA25T00005459001.1